MVCFLSLSVDNSHVSLAAALKDLSNTGVFSSMRREFFVVFLPFQIYSLMFLAQETRLFV